MIGGSNATEQLSELRPWPTPAQLIALEERRARPERARQLTRNLGADALVVIAGPSLNYFLGVNWRLSERLVALVVTPSRPAVLVASKFEHGSLSVIVELPVEPRFWEEGGSPFDLVADIFTEDNVEFVAVDPTMPFAMSMRLSKAIAGVRMTDAAPMIDGCRMIKSFAELNLLRQVKQMTLEVQRRAALISRAGIRLSKVVRFIDDAHRAIGSAGKTFCIVPAQNGSRSRPARSKRPFDDVARRLAIGCP